MGSFASVPRKAALPYRLDGDGRGAVVLLHGFTGHPGETRFVGERLALEGFTAIAPRLPGHGSSGSDFAATDSADWFRRALDAASDALAEFAPEAGIENRGETVGILGHSMGGALACAVSARLGLTRTVLFAPALSISIPHIDRMRFLRLILPVVKNASEETHADSDARILFEEYRKHARTAQLDELRKVRDLALSSLPELRGEVLVVTGELDDSVRKRSVELLKKGATGAKVTHVELRGCGHTFPFAHGRREAAELARAWFAREGPRRP
jgi:carboxylesterase